MLGESSLFNVIAQRMANDPLLGWALGLFAGAILHSFLASFIAKWVHGLPARFRVVKLLLEPLAEVEYVFILWAVPLMMAFGALKGWGAVGGYLTQKVSFIEPFFVFVVMLMAATKPILNLCERGLRYVAQLCGGGVGGWWIALVCVAPFLGSLITEPAAITVAALLLGKNFFAHRPSVALSYFTLALLLVNISIGGVLTHFAAPPIVVVAKAWNLTTPFLFNHFAFPVIGGGVLCGLLVRMAFYREFRRLSASVAFHPSNTPCWLTLVHVGLLVLTVFFAHTPVALGILLLSLFVVLKIFAPYQESPNIGAAAKVGVFLAGLVIMGGLQSGWVEPVLTQLSGAGLFAISSILSAFNDNAAITYLASQVPGLSPRDALLVLSGAISAGGLTIIANAPNPAGCEILKRHFPGAVINPLRLFGAALLPTLILSYLFLSYLF